jgi:hypothetical protein
MIYPNPLESSLNIDIIESQDSVSLNNENLKNEVNVEFYNDQGFLIKSFISNKKHNLIDVQSLKPGLYVIKITHPEGVNTMQIRKK